MNRWGRGDGGILPQMTDYRYVMGLLLQWLAPLNSLQPERTRLPIVELLPQDRADGAEFLRIMVLEKV